jgi:predicted RNase H-like HicB family nuclease
MTTIKNRAKLLALRKYLSFVFLDRANASEPIYVALNPDLDGCVAIGQTVPEALANLDEVRLAYVEHLLEHHLPVPEPSLISHRLHKPIGERAVQPRRTKALKEVLHLAIPDQPVLEILEQHITEPV